MGSSYRECKSKGREPNDQACGHVPQGGAAKFCSETSPLLQDSSGQTDWGGSKNKEGGKGAVLNSRSEFNRCFIPRLRVIREEDLAEMEELDRQKEQGISEELQDQEEEWAKTKSVKRAGATKGKVSKVGSAKRDSRSNLGRDRPTKRRKYELVESSWGVKTTLEERKTTLDRLVCQDSQEVEDGGSTVEEDLREMITTRVDDQDPPLQDPDTSSEEGSQGWEYSASTTTPT